MSLMRSGAKRGRVSSIVFAVVLVLGTVGFHTIPASANALPPLWGLQRGFSTMVAGAVDHFDYIAQTDPAGGYANQPVTVTDSISSTVTVTAVPSGTGWNCAATVVGSSSFSCVYDPSKSIPPGTMLPLIWVWVQFADYSGTFSSTTTVNSSDAISPTVNDWTFTISPAAHPVGLTTSAGEAVTQTVPAPAGTGPFSYALGAALPSSWGSLSINSSTGALTYSPAAGVSGVVTGATYTVTDAHGNVSSQYSATDGSGTVCNPGSITLTVQPIATAAAGSSTGPSAVVVDLPTPTGSGPFSYAMATRPPSADGTTSIDSNTGQVTFAPALGFTGTAGGTYSVTDSTGATSAPEAVSFTVNEPAGPTGGNQTATATATQGLVIGLPDNGAAPLSYALTGTLPSSSEGTVTINSSTGSVTFEAGDYSGPVSQFGYSVTDQYGQSASGLINITVLPLTQGTGGSETAPTPIVLDVPSMSAPKGTGPFIWYLTNLPPSADATASINASTGVITVTPAFRFTGTVPTFDYYVVDADGDRSALSTVETNFSMPSAPVATNKEYGVTAGGSVSEYASDGFQSHDTGAGPFSTQVISGPSHGTLNYASDGSFQYTPAAGFSGNDYLSYNEYDVFGQLSNTAQVWFEVDPVAYTVTASSTAPAAVVTGIPTPLGTGPFTCSLVGQMPPSWQGAVSLNASTCTFTFTPAAGFAGNVQSFQYSVSGQGGTGSQPAAVHLQVLAPAAPAAADQSLTTPAGTELTVAAASGLQVGDSGTGPLTSTLVDAPANGDAGVNADGSFTYTPDAGFSGIDSFTFTDTDAYGQTSAPATITLAVTPTVSDIFASATGPASIFATPAAPVGTGPFTWALVTGPSVNVGTAYMDPLTGGLWFTPDHGFSGEVPTFTYTVSDAAGLSPVVDGNISLEIRKPPAPQVTGVASSTPVNTVLSLQGSATTSAIAGPNILNESIANRPIQITGLVYTYALSSQPAAAWGTAAIDATTGAITFSPAVGVSGVVPSFGYTATDQYNQTSQPGAVDITITPSATSVGGTGSAGTSTVSVPAPTLTGTGPFTCSLATTPPATAGTATIDPTTCVVSFTPAAGFSGPVPSFTYTATDAAGTSTTAQVTLTIRPTAPPLTATLANSGGVAVTLQLPAPQGTGPFSFEMVSSTAPGSQYGTLGLTTAGLLTVTPPAAFSGSIPDFSYEVADASGTLSLPATVTLTVTIPAVVTKRGSGSPTPPPAASPLPTPAVISAAAPTEPPEGAVAPSANTATTAPAGDPLAAAARSGLGFPAAPLAGIVVILVGLCFCFLWIRRRRGQDEA